MAVFPEVSVVTHVKLPDPGAVRTPVAGKRVVEEIPQLSPVVGDPPTIAPHIPESDPMFAAAGQVMDGFWLSETVRTIEHVSELPEESVTVHV